MFFFSDRGFYDLSANATASQTAQSVMAFPALAHRFNRAADFNEGNWIASQPFHIAVLLSFLGFASHAARSHPAKEPWQGIRKGPY